MRKEFTITINDGGQDKRFKIRQMPATQAERFMFKLIFLIGGQAEIEKLQDMGAVLEAMADKPFEKVQELLDSLLACVSLLNEGGIETQLDPDNVDGFVEEMSTLLKLRAEAFKANSFFQQNGANASDVSPAPVTIKRRG